MRALLLSALGAVALWSAPADAQRPLAGAGRLTVHNSVLRIPSGGPFPVVETVRIGVGKSLMDAGTTQGLKPDQLAALSSLWSPISKSLLGGK